MIHAQMRQQLQKTAGNMFGLTDLLDETRPSVHKTLGHPFCIEVGGGHMNSLNLRCATLRLERGTVQTG